MQETEVLQICFNDIGPIPPPRMFCDSNPVLFNEEVPTVDSMDYTEQLGFVEEVPTKG